MNRYATAALLVPLLAGLMFGQDPPVGVPPEQEARIQLNNISLEQFVQSVSKRTKKTFIYGDPIAQVLRAARVQLVAFKDFSDREALFSLFLSMLQVHGPQPGGLVLVENKPDEYKIVTANDARRDGVPVVSESRTPNGSFVTRIFDLKYTSSQEAFTAFVNLVTPAAVAQFTGSQMIVVTDVDYNIKKCEEVIKAIDVKKPDMVTRVVPLKQAVAADVELMLRTLLQGIIQQSRGRQPGIPNMPGSEQVTVVADRRTNSVLILAEPGRIDQIQALVESLDREPEFETSGTFIIPLRHRDAEDIARILNGLYRITTDTTTGLPSGGSTSATVKPNQVIAPAATQPAIQGSSFSSSSSQQTGTEPTILADKKTNSVVLVTDRNTYQMLSRLVQRLDRRRPQVLIKASVVEVQASETFDLGTELARAVDPDGITTTFARTNMGYSTLTLVGGVPSIVPSDTPGVTLAVLKDRFGNIPLLFKALEDKAKITVIDEPEVACEDNGEATIALSNTIQIPQSTVTTGIAQTTFTPLKAETTLKIKPHITQGGYLRLETEVKIEKFGATSAVLAAAPPPINTRQVNTPFHMAGGRTAVIGGIVSNDRTDSETSVPLLGDIPVFGFLFKRVRQIDVKRTLYIFITPHILYDESFGDLSNATQERLDDIIFGKRSPELVEGLHAAPAPEPRPRSTFKFPTKSRE